MKQLWLIPLVLLLLACNGGKQEQARRTADSLCRQAIRMRYADADSAASLARHSMMADKNYEEGYGRALGVLAYERYQKMDYAHALKLLDTVPMTTDNEITLLQADVMRMKVCQRIGDGMGFFQARSRALRHIDRIEEEATQLKEMDGYVYLQAWSEYHIIASTYYYYQQQDSLAKAEMRQIEERDQVLNDTTQWLYYSYMMGSGGLVEGDPCEVVKQEFDYLIHCFAMARRCQVTYFEANALQALAVRLKTPSDRAIIRDAYPDAYTMLYGQHLSWMAEGVQPSDSLLPLALAEHALQLFHAHGDLFQTACVYRTIGEIMADMSNHEGALYALQCALACVNEHHKTYYPYSQDSLKLCDEALLGGTFTCQEGNAGSAAPTSIERKWIDDPDVITVPDWMSGIRQQISLLYSAMGWKQASDYNRNIYLDILESTTQNREMESRMQELEEENEVQHHLLVAAALLFVFVVVLVAYLFLTMKRHNGGKHLKTKGEKGTVVLRRDQQRLEALSEELEEVEEECCSCAKQIELQKERNVERRAKVALVQAVTPLLDRIIHEVRRMKQEGPESQRLAHRLQYVCELCDRIIAYNDILTQWIKIEQGSLSLHVTTLPLAPLFQLLRMGHFAFDQKGVQFSVAATDLQVKADEALTLFMLNTLADNARKFTPPGGRVSIEASATEQYVELSVSDTGCGMSEEDIRTILSSKVYDASKIGSNHSEGKGHGFGLMNCKGIIEKYRKTAAVFSVCSFGIESRVGEGSRFFFRLPRVRSLLVWMLGAWCLPHAAKATPQAPAPLTDTTMAPAYYAACFQANIEGRHADALCYADSALYAISSKLTLQASGSEPYELTAFGMGAQWDFPLIINLRNEVAVAALALHEWDLYAYNNRICTTLHKLIHQDRQLPTYCDELERAQSINKQTTVILVLLSLLAVGLSALIMRRRHKRADGMVDALQEQIDDRRDQHARLKFEEHRLYVHNQVLDNCLSTIKHESMFYPARIRQLAERNLQLQNTTSCTDNLGEGQANGGLHNDDIVQLNELSDYYRELYSLLCSQAERQVAHSGYRRENITLPELTLSAQTQFRNATRKFHSTAKLHISEHQPGNMVTVCADRLLLAQLFAQLFAYLVQQFTNELNFQLDIEMLQDNNKQAQLRIVCTSNAMHFNDTQAHELFYPDPQRIPLLSVKQILRDIDQLNNNPGLRLLATHQAIIFTLPLFTNEREIE
ncbi:MAG: DUF5112 domain-containing protein [Bacteroidales bacterium]|nr:DUF5112 domain-containing protein [Candidatus Physcousia equi]